MNKKQLFATANEDEQRWLIILTAQVIEERKQRVIFSASLQTAQIYVSLKSPSLPQLMQNIGPTLSIVGFQSH